jgi:hypothetical protein
MSEEAMYVVVDDAKFNSVGNEDICRSLQQWAAEPGLDVFFWSAGDEELDPGDLRNRLSQHEEHGRFRFFVSALVEGVDNDHDGDIRRLERFDEEHLHLVLKRLVYDVWI